MIISEIRRVNFERLLEAHGGVTRMAEKMDCSKSYISQLRSTRQIGSRTARKLEETFGAPLGWMDVSHENEALVKDLARELSALGLERLEALRSLIHGGGATKGSLSVPTETIKGVSKLGTKKPRTAHAPVHAAKGR